VSWTLVTNPGITGPPRPLQAVCHDRSPFVTIVCGGCGFEMHVHETQLPSLPRTEIVTLCNECGELLEFPSGFLADAFRRLRVEGWIA